MQILVIGAAGMVGVKLVNRLAADGRLAGKPVSRLTRHDVVIAPPPPKSAFQVDTFASDLSTPGEAEKLMSSRPDVIFHLAAIVSEVGFQRLETEEMRPSHFSAFPGAGFVRAHKS